MNYWIEPLQLLIICYTLSSMAEFIGELLIGMKLVFKRKLFAIIFNLVVYAMTCNKCFSFWMTLIMTGNLFIACCVAILTNIIKKLEYKFTKKETEL